MPIPQEALQGLLPIPTTHYQTTEAMSISLHIRLFCKHSVQDGFRRHPSERKPALRGRHIQIGLPGQAKIRDLQDLVSVNEHISAGQVTVHDAQRSKILLMGHKKEEGAHKEVCV